MYVYVCVCGGGGGEAIDYASAHRLFDSIGLDLEVKRNRDVLSYDAVKSLKIRQHFDSDVRLILKGKTRLGPLQLQ